MFRAHLVVGHLGEDPRVHCCSVEREWDEDGGFCMGRLHAA